MVAAVGVQEDGLPGRVYVAHMVASENEEQPWEVWKPRSVHELPGDFLQTIQVLEDDLSRMRKPRAGGDNRDRAVLIHVSTAPSTAAEDSLAELRELARAAGIEVVHTVIQRRDRDPKFVLGKGKLKWVVIKAMQLGAEVLVFDQNLSPAQITSLSRFTDLKILDRTQVILDIFAQRAQTREGKIQVELAQLRYLLPRLGMKQTESALSRLTGGIGGRGPGETKLEIDRRRATERIAHLAREVDKLGQRRKLRRGMRERNDMPLVAIVGYTNAGKSTLLNQLTQSEVVAEDALFATLNPVSRRLRFPREREIIITDTVGFIRELPADLMAAFRTTLEEIAPADLVLHVVDASSPYLDDHLDTVDAILKELELDGKPTLLVFNKMDRCDPELLQGLVSRYRGIAVSALDKASLAPLMDEMDRILFPVVNAAANL